MAEAEDVITDAARHATEFIHGLWRRHRARRGRTVPPTATLADVGPRLDLLLSAVFGQSWTLRTAEPPAPATWLTRAWRRREGPRVEHAVPATDGQQLWLPATLANSPALDGMAQYRIVALQQAQRAHDGLAGAWRNQPDPFHQAVCLVLGAQAADLRLWNRLPGIRDDLQRFRTLTLQRRPPLNAFPAWRLPMEQWLRRLLSEPPASPVKGPTLDPAHTAAWVPLLGASPHPPGRLLWRDAWTGELRADPPTTAGAVGRTGDGSPSPPEAPMRSAKLSRRPRQREAVDGEDDSGPGAWMVQTSQPHEAAEDPFGMQRPTDRDQDQAAEELADAVGELQEARLVSTPGRPREVLWSEDAPQFAPRSAQDAHDRSDPAADRVHYPEWDHRLGSYSPQLATVHLRTGDEGPVEWVQQTLTVHRTLVEQVSRQFQVLRARRERLRAQNDGDEVDLDACLDAWADRRAGLPPSTRLYETTRHARRDMAIHLLVDISGSTDAWVAGTRRVIDVEREALLVVAHALSGLHEPFAIDAFSGEGQQGVQVWRLKTFAEPMGDTVSRRIAALEPQHFTRVGAPLRHASAALMHETAAHRLLVLLSDGKPSDNDHYEGRHGIEDFRQAVAEARLQGIRTFCLTVDRQAAAYLPHVFGPGQYAVLKDPQRLPAVLVDWLRRLLQS